MEKEQKEVDVKSVIVVLPTSQGLKLCAQNVVCDQVERSAHSYQNFFTYIHYIWGKNELTSDSIHGAWQEWLFYIVLDDCYYTPSEK